ncbi:hypothetical protein BH23GEM6_BH23GEM6_02070 [soil metagenome]
MDDTTDSSPVPRSVAVSGSTGMIGSALVASLERDGVDVRRIVRGKPGKKDIAWDPSAGSIDAASLQGVEAVVHLAGEPIGERWTSEKKKRILESRVGGTRTLAEAIGSLDSPPRVLVSASGVGYYGDRGDELLTEESSPGDDFLASVVQQWEAALAPAARAESRVVRLRFGVVLSTRGGALDRLLTPFKLGVGGRLGSGRQWMSWISLDDVIRVIRFALSNDQISGPINAVAPEQVTNADFTQVLGSVLNRPTIFQVPAPALRLAFGEMAEGTLLVSQRAVPARLQAAGFDFSQPRLEEALRAALQR